MQGRKRLTAGSSIVTRIVSVLVAGIVLAIALAFSVILFAALLAGGLLLLGYVLWKTRPLRKRMREASAGGTIVEGNAVSHRNTEPIERP